jgi:hypothetical protein
MNASKKYLIKTLVLLTLILSVLKAHGGELSDLANKLSREPRRSDQEDITEQIAPYFLWKSVTQAKVIFKNEGFKIWPQSSEKEIMGAKEIQRDFFGYKEVFIYLRISNGCVESMFARRFTHGL